MKVAHGVSNQNCVLCDSSFETKDELESHTSRVHEKITKKPDPFKLEFYVAK